MNERGMTLIELLVAMMLSAIVIFAASAIIISALNVTNQVTQRVNALAEGRTGMEALLGQLNSGCLVAGVSPVQFSTSPTTLISPAVSSDANDLVFVSGVSDSATPTPTLHVVAVNSKGALIDSAYGYAGDPSSVATPSTWKFSTATSQVLNLAEHVTTGGGAMFTYSAYPITAPYSLLNPTPLSPLTSATAPTVAEVDLDFRFAPSAAKYSPTTTSELRDSAIFSLTAHDSTPNAPCQ